MTLAEAAARLVRFAGAYRWQGSGHADVRRVLEASGVSLMAVTSEWSLAIIGAGTPVTPQLVTDALSSAGRAVVVLAHASGGGAPLRETIDRAAIDVGFRRHPHLLSLVGYSEIEHELGWILVPLERVPASLTAQYPIEWLAASRDLHMDMTREAGRRSDAHMARYHFASGLIRGKARILDAACGLGYGSTLLARAAAGRTVLGVDSDSSSIAYAQHHFGDAPTVAFETHDVLDLSGIPTRSVDAVVSFETVEHVADPARFLGELHRVTRRGAPIIASVPYRWFEGSDLGPHHLDWYDATKLIRLFSRFFLVDGMWRQTAGGGAFCSDSPRDLQRLPALGAEPCEATEWLVIAARRGEVRPRPRKKDWVCLAPGAPQLATMLAAMRHRGIAPADVTVWGCSQVADDAFHVAMRDVATAYGGRYHGNLFVAPDVTAAGDPLDYQPDDPRDRAACGARVLAATPILRSLRGVHLMMPARTDMPSDYALVAGARPAVLELVADGIQNHLVVRDFRGAAGFADNALAQFPTLAPVACPPWLAAETATIGRPAVLPSRTCRQVLREIGRIPALTSLARELSDRRRPFGAVIVSQHLTRAGLTTFDAEIAFYFHQVRILLRRTPGRILFKAHPRDPHEKLRAIEQALGASAARVRITTGVESHAPLEAFPQLARRKGRLLVWGASSTALLGVRDWSGTAVSCVDAEYLESEFRRQALQFARRHNFPQITLQFSDDDLTEAERADIRRRFAMTAHVPALGFWNVLESQTRPLTAAVAGLEREGAQLRRDATRWSAGHQRLANELEALRVERDTVRAHSHTRLLGLLRDSRHRPLVIWGAGSGGRRLRAVLPRRTMAFVDSDVAKAGSTLDGLRIIAPHDLAQQALADAFVVIASVHSAQIAARLVAAGREDGTDFVTVDATELEAFEHARSSDRESLTPVAACE